MKLKMSFFAQPTVSPQHSQLSSWDSPFPELRSSVWAVAAILDSSALSRTILVVATILDSSTKSRMIHALSSCGIKPFSTVPESGRKFFSFLKKKKRLCVYSLQCRALAAQMQLCGVEAEGAGPLISREAPPASVGEHPGLGLGGG